MTNATLLRTQVTPNDCGIQKGSGCSLWTPCPNSGLRRWLSRCLCLTRRGHWPDPLPSSCSLGWWHLRSAAGCGESRSCAERPVDECSAPPSHPGGVPSPSWVVHVPHESRSSLVAGYPLYGRVPLHTSGVCARTSLQGCSMVFPSL
jgi:hypothetical protein